MQDWTLYTPSLCVPTAIQNKRKMFAVLRESWTPPPQLLSPLPSLRCLGTKKLHRLHRSGNMNVTHSHHFTAFVEILTQTIFLTVASCCHVEMLMCLAAKFSLRLDFEKSIGKFFSSHIQNDLYIINISVESTLHLFFSKGPFEEVFE